MCIQPCVCGMGETLRLLAPNNYSTEPMGECSWRGGMAHGYPMAWLASRATGDCRTDSVRARPGQRFPSAHMPASDISLQSANPAHTGPTSAEAAPDLG